MSHVSWSHLLFLAKKMYFGNMGNVSDTFACAKLCEMSAIAKCLRHIDTRHISMFEHITNVFKAHNHDFILIYASLLISHLNLITIILSFFVLKNISCYNLIITENIKKQKCCKQQKA